ncbi:L-serine ammonia-lyase, iron-sulfur-dependent, subunit beta [Paenibacillus sp. CAA11]|uniref:L-serine ammonia-lyase, iron-sulfur-dependent subunit beta n=1 Tax=Paenibacillus sp. CAA11 TaxID=1532905 RepID=UPI000D391C3D|nr:L-serine ammonia-lyase, iron-sulfur-dependent subunit beta [Paenibacillus sp. CAA11]AWB45558.1 L-serine ammonia-lyase, iron-sulfur-dependent, subunit beta [Paenibacillus sp. CAA11]
MRFKDIFSIIGPAMVGPSSSHTAGAVRIGRVARLLFGECPASAEILLFGSFAATYQGHGTDTALVGGLLDMAPDDPRLPESFRHAEAAEMAVTISPGKGLYPHPNTAKLHLANAAGDQTLQLTGTSIGGGNVEIVGINGFNIKLSASYPTLAIRHRDEPGVIAIVTGLLGGSGINIAHMSVDRRSRSGEAMMVLECDGIPAPEMLEAISALPMVREIRLLSV